MNVRIEELSPMLVASICAVSAHPEIDAWEKLREWAEPLGLLDDLAKHPVFGFNNPAPSSNKDTYGYEFWIKIAQDVEVRGDLKTKDFPGGIYAVTTIKGYPNPVLWKQLWDWVQSSQYKWRKTHELENPLNPQAPEEEIIFNLFLPIE